MGEQRSVCSHVHNVSVALKVGHESSLVERSLEVIPFLSLSVAGIFAGEYLRTLAVIALIAQTVREEPMLVAIEMLVHEVSLQLLHSLPSLLEHLALRVRTRCADKLDVRILRLDGFHEGAQTLIVEVVPLLVADSEELEVERCGMSHLRTLLAPCGVDVAVGKLDEVQTVLNVGLKILHCHVS